MGLACCSERSFLQGELDFLPVAWHGEEQASERLESPSAASTSATEGHDETLAATADTDGRDGPLTPESMAPAAGAVDPCLALPEAGLGQGLLPREEVPTLPPELLGTWQAIPGTLEGLDRLLSLRGVSRREARLARVVVSRASPKLVIRQDDSSGVVVVQNHSALSIPGCTDQNEFQLDGSLFKVTLVEGGGHRTGKGRGCVNRTSLVLRVQHAEGTRRSDWRVEKGQLMEVVRQEHGGKGGATLTRRYERCPSPQQV